ncbi:MAG: GNAT family N-acetyltransferase [Armatimonadetes bacterium]|nr:GNAT family N-acetyltransferase [Armatimonadota bacterium]
MIELQPFTRADFRRLIDWSPTPEFLMQWAGPYFTFPLDEAQLGAYLQGAEGDSPVRRIFRVADGETGTVIGHIELGLIHLAHGSATVHRVLIGDPAYRGRGFGREMIRKIQEIAFDEMNLHRLELVVFDFNESARRCYEKAGFKVEGHHRECRRVGEAYWSIYWMGMLEQEWRAPG